jgi:hypothetical protein
MQLKITGGTWFSDYIFKFKMDNSIHGLSLPWYLFIAEREGSV